MTALVCILCGSRAAETRDGDTCGSCGPEGIFEVETDLDAARRIAVDVGIGKTRADRLGSISRYGALLPVAASFVRDGLDVCATPIVPAPRLAQRLNVAALQLKDETGLPTGSLKDRASAIALARARAQRIATIACASTGNAACSLSGLAARAGLATVVFVPAAVPAAKLAQIRAYGGRVHLVDGTYADAFEVSRRTCIEQGWYERNSAVNPYLIEGKKTCGLEIGEQLASDPPDVLVVAVGDGCSIAGIAKGVREMHALGVLPAIPRLVGVQAEGARAVADAWRTGALSRSASAHSVADSIQVSQPRNWRKAVRAVSESHGSFVTVTDEAIVDAAYELSRTGVLGDLASSAALAGLIEARGRGLVNAADRVVLVVTGSGLKDLDGRRSIRSAEERDA